MIEISIDLKLYFTAVTYLCMSVSWVKLLFVEVIGTHFFVNQ